MEKESKKITRRTFLKTGLAAGGMAATGLPVFSRQTLCAEPKEVKIGLLAPLTGTSAYWGESTYKIFELAAKITNEEGGIKSMGGAKIKVIVADTETKPEVAGIQAEKLIADKDILMITGTNQSAAGMVVSQIAERNRICFITGTDMVPEITLRGFQYTYRTCLLWSDLARDMVYFAKEMGQKTGAVVKKMAVLCENSYSGTQVGQSLAKFGKEVGFDVVDHSTYDAVTTRDFTGYISKYKNAGVNFLVGHTRVQDGILIVRTAKELNFNPYALAGIAGGIVTTEYGPLLGKESNYLVGASGITDAAENIPILKKIIPRYKKELQKETADPSLVGGFGVIPVLKAALEKSPTYDREGFKNAVDKVEVKAGEYNNLQIEGIKWDAKHDNTLGKSFIIMWENNVMYAVAPEKYAAKKPVWPRPNWDKI